MTKLWKVTKHEFKMTAANKAFIILTILGPFLILGVTVAPSLLSQNKEGEDIRLAVLGAGEQIYRQISPPLAALGIQLERARTSKAELNRLLLEDGLHGYLVFPEDILSGGSLELATRDFSDFRMVELIKGIIGRAVMEAHLQEAGLDTRKIKILTAPLAVKTSQITKKGQRPTQDTLSYILVGIAFTLMLYMTILLYGQSIGRSVAQEKISKTVEIMLSSVSEQDLLFGKILGQGAAGLLQYTVWIGMALLGGQILGPRLGLARLPQLSLPVLLFFILFFLLGFLLYAAMYAALGAAVEDEQNLSQMAWPLIIFLIIPMVSVGPIILNPNSAFSVFLSLFPLTSPIVMFVRILVNDPRPWQVALSITILGVSIPVLMLLSAKIFRVGILMTGKRFTLAEILHWLRN